MTNNNTKKVIRKRYSDSADSNKWGMYGCKGVGGLVAIGSGLWPLADDALALALGGSQNSET